MGDFLDKERKNTDYGISPWLSEGTKRAGLAGSPVWNVSRNVKWKLNFWRQHSKFSPVVSLKVSYLSILIFFICQFSSVQSLSHVRLIATPWITAHQASLSITNSRSLLRLMPIESVMPFIHLILYHPLLLLSPIPPSIRVFPTSQLFAWGGQSIGVSTSASILPMNTWDLSPSGWTGWISLQSKGFSRVFSNTTVQKHKFFGTQLSSQSNSHIHTWQLEKP